MFKKLRSKLSAFEEELEKELEAQLEDELEAELAAELGKEADPEPAPEPGPARTETAPQPPLEPTPEPAPKPATEAKPAEAPTPEPAPAAPDVDAEPKLSPSQPAITKPAPAPKPVPAPEPAPTPKSTPTPVEPAAAVPATPEVRQAEPPAPAPPSSPAAPARKERVRKPGGPVAKSEADLEAEVAASLEAELGRAVDTQRAVEQSVGEVAAGARIKISDEKLDDLLWELEVVLLESDVALPVVEAIKNNVRDQLKEARVSKRGIPELVQRVLKTAVRNVLSEPFDFDGYVEKAEKPAVIMFIGVNGTGKTTAIAKITHRLKGRGKSVVLAAGDTFRAGAVAQLEQHANRLGVKMIKHEGGKADPAAVGFDAIEHAKSRHKDVVLLDTAGRMGTNVNLMDEMEKIKRVCQPDLIFFVGDSLAGNDAVAQADKFNEVVGIDGVILTKVDADAKGGAALSVAYAIGKPLVFIGLGQEYEDLVPFDRDWMVERIFADTEEDVVAAA